MGKVMRLKSRYTKLRYVSLLFFQVVFTIFYGLRVEKKPENIVVAGQKSAVEFESCPNFEHVTMFIFFGYGFLRSHLKRFGYSAITLNTLLAAFSIQLAYLMDSLLVFEKKDFTKSYFLKLEMIAQSSLVTFGVLLGIVTTTQLLFICSIGTILSSVIEFVLAEKLKIYDNGGAYRIHLFGALYGFAVNCAMRIRGQVGDATICNDYTLFGPSYTSNIFSLTGSIIMWLHFPSVNTYDIEVGSDEYHRAYINTIVALLSSTVTAFLLSSLVIGDIEGKFSMRIVQNSSLTGGVVVSAIASQSSLSCGLASFLGTCCSAISIYGYLEGLPLIREKFGVFDTCGVIFIHGIPGLISGLLFIAFGEIKAIVGLLLALLFGSLGFLVGFLVQYPVFGEIEEVQRYNDEYTFDLSHEGM